MGGVSTIALLGHTDCGMVHVTGKREAFITGLVKAAGWEPAAAGEYFDRFAQRYEIDDAVEFTVAEALRLRREFPRLLVAPLLYNIADDRLAQIQFGNQHTPPGGHFPIGMAGDE